MIKVHRKPSFYTCQSHTYIHTIRRLNKVAHKLAHSINHQIKRNASIKMYNNCNLNNASDLLVKQCLYFFYNKQCLYIK